MSRFAWKPEYSVENDAVDKDHQGFFELASELDVDQLDDARLDDVLKRLEDYAQGHFVREEALMAAINYPELESHRQNHERFRQWLAELRQSQRDTQEQARLVGDFLENWLVEHILKDDMRYRDYIMMKN